MYQALFPPPPPPPPPPRIIRAWVQGYYMCVREREVTGSRSTATQNVPFLCKTTAGRYTRDPTNTTSKSTGSRLKEALLQSVVQKLDREVGLYVWRPPRDCQRAQVGNRDCPWTVQGDRRFYSKHLLLRAVTSVATEQTSFLAI